jgi:hypothetical protein
MSGGIAMNLMKDGRVEAKNMGAGVTNPTESKDRVIVQVLEEYLTVLESGREPDREGLLARCPEHADELLLRLDGLDFIHQIAPLLAEPENEAGAATPQIQPTGNLA